jgi:transposase-like protein
LDEGNEPLILEEVEKSGSGVTEIACRHDIVPQQIYDWRKMLRRDVRSSDGSGVTLLPMALRGPDLESEIDRTAAAEKVTASCRALRSSAKMTRHESRCLDCAANAECADPVGGSFLTRRQHWDIVEAFERAFSQAEVLQR